ncbi:MBL fold metallo-hydrolase [Tsukamurella sp. TY48]|uniref:MBL fold metallo-hydrolase n=1 Tax=Tsukamurella TaxID=2060 RepID=UPI001C7CA640|nr:MBL fold metallo-hydrolase [Tsukamurella sp. TY48]
MEITELNAGTLRPDGGRAVWGADELVCRCLLLQDNGLVAIVDAGIGLVDIADPVGRLGQDWLDMARPALDPAETVYRQLQSRDIDPALVGHIIVTHQHRDHIGGLADFPDAEVHLSATARRAVTAIGGDAHSADLSPQWAHGVRWAGDPRTAPDWHGLSTYTLVGLPRTIRLLPLPGHADGHSGVLIETKDGFVLHVGDAAFHPAQYTEGTVPPGLAAFTTATEHCPTARHDSERTLTEIHANHWATILTSHWI